METEVTRGLGIEGITIRNFNPDEFDGLTITIKGASAEQEAEALKLVQGSLEVLEFVVQRRLELQAAWYVMGGSTTERARLLMEAYTHIEALLKDAKDTGDFPF